MHVYATIESTFQKHLLLLLLFDFIIVSDRVYRGFQEAGRQKPRYSIWWIGVRYNSDTSVSTEQNLVDGGSWQLQYCYM